jgi:hypothetical protein
MTKGGKNNTQKRRSGKKHQIGGWLWSKKDPNAATPAQDDNQSSGFLGWFKSSPKPTQEGEKQSDEKQSDEKKSDEKKSIFSGLFGNAKADKKEEVNTNNAIVAEKVDVAQKTEAVEPKVGGKRRKTAKKQHKKHHKK